MTDVEFYRDLCRPLGTVTAQRMFGGLCLKHAGLPFALVIRDVLYFKTDADTAQAFVARGLGPFSYTRSTGVTSVMSYHRAPEEVYDDPDVFADWARGAIAAAGRAAAEKARPKTRRTRGRKGAAGDATA